LIINNTIENAKNTPIKIDYNEDIKKISSGILV